MAGKRGLFTSNATEADRAGFYVLMDQIGVDFQSTRAPSRAANSDRSHFGFHGELEEKKELRALAAHFQTTEAAMIRVAYRIGIGIIAQTLNGPEHGDAAQAL